MPREHTDALSRKNMIEKRKEEAERREQEKTREEARQRLEEEARRKAEESSRLAREAKIREKDKMQRVCLKKPFSPALRENLLSKFTVNRISTRQH